MAMHKVWSVNSKLKVEREREFLDFDQTFDRVKQVKRR
jgi:pterin-4a-carbinolamine dehydratase